LRAAARAAIVGLPERCHEIFVLSRVHGLSYSEIASALGISVSTVKTQMGRALAAISARLTPLLALTFVLRR
jgi:RNA polymerase sigma-70 factor (ECF subfamily)